MSFLTKFKEAFSLHPKGSRWDLPNRFETSWCIPPYILFGLRAVLSLYIFTTLFVIIAWDCAHDDPSDPDVNGCSTAGDNFSYFTTLTYWGLGFYFAFSAFHTFTYARYGTPAIDSWPRLLKAAHSFLYTTIVVFPFIVSAVYWALLFETWFETRYRAWTNISQHAMNSGFALFEVLLTRTDVMPWAHTWYLILVLAGYLGVSYLTEATKGFYTYSFLDPEVGDKGDAGVAAYVIGILAGTVVVFMVVRGLVWARKRLTEGVLGLDGRFAKQTSWRRRDEELAGGVEMK